MPNTEIKLPNLTPGKRYRMVISTNSDVNGSTNVASNTTSAPSLEFVVPTSPRLISTYTPTCRTVTQLHDLPGTYDPPATGGGLIPGTGTSDVQNSVAVTRFHNTSGNNYSLYTTAMPPLQQKVYVSGVSSGSAPFYFNWLEYTVKTASGSKVTLDGVGRQIYKDIQSPNGWKVTGSPAVSTANKNKVTDGNGVLWSTKNGVGWGNDISKAGMTINWTTPGVAAQYYPIVDPAPYPITLPNAGTYYHVDVSAPLDLKDQLVWTNTVRDIVYFFYIDNGVYYDFGPIDDIDRSFVDGSNSIVNATTLSPLFLDNAAFTTGIYKNGVILTARDRKVNDVATGSVAPAITRSYRFSVARYVFDGTTTWRGRWLQTDSTFATNPALNKIVISQPGVMTI